MRGLAAAHTSSYQLILSLIIYLLVQIIHFIYYFYYITVLLFSFYYFVRSQKQYCTVPSLSVHTLIYSNNKMSIQGPKP